MSLYTFVETTDAPVTERATPVSASAPIAPRGIVRTFDAVIDDVNTVKRSVVARINTSSRDRYNTVIAPKGCQSKNWRAAGGPVLWEHGKDPRRFTDPIANSRNLWNNGGPMPTELIAEPVFLDDDFSQQRFEWYRDGKVKGWSVNILPVAKSVSPPTKDELRARPDWEDVELVYREWDLAEFSGTVIPGNAEALTSDRVTGVMEMVERGLLWLPDEARSIYEARARTMTSSGGMATGGAAVEPQERRIVEEGGKYYVLSEEGKHLGGPYGSRGEAEKRLEQVEYFKHKDKDHRSAPYIDGDGRTVRAADGSVIAVFDSTETAQNCLASMAAPRTWQSIHDDMMTTQQARNSAIASEIQAMLDLMIHGRV